MRKSKNMQQLHHETGPYMSKSKNMEQLRT
jgi:hypothetical protein